MKFLLLLAFFAPLVIGKQLIGGNHCTWGPSYWCQHIDSAKECGAFDHCVSKVWKNEKISELEFQKGNHNCGYCQIIVMNIDSLLKHQKTEKEISEILNESCEAMKHTDVIPMCKKLSTKYLHEIVTMLNKNMKPEKICAILKLCKEKSKKNSQLLETFVAETPKRVEDVKVPVKVGGAVCDECHMFMTYIKAMISQNGAEALVEEYLSQLVCEKVPSELNAVCKELVKEMVPKVIAMIKSDLNATDICKMIGVCQSKNMATLRSARQSLYMLHIHASTLKGIECDYCEMVITAIRAFITNKNDEEAIEDFIKNNLCGHLGPLADKCKTYVNEFMPEILDLIKSEMDPKSVCAALGACSKSTVSKLPASHKLEASPECSVCQTVMAYLESLIKKNATEQNIIKLLDRICSFLPSKDKTQCDYIIKHYTPLIIQLLAAELNPSQICAVIRLCTGDTVKIAPTKAPLLGANPCTWGPSYWCKSEKHALSCGSDAHQHCKERIWNKDSLKFHPDRL